MTDDIVYLAIFLTGMAAGASLVGMLPFVPWFKRHIADGAPEPQDPEARERVQAILRSPQNTVYSASRGKSDDSVQFDVTGKPRAVPWHIRKRELEEAHRTKRRRLESFREVD